MLLREEARVKAMQNEKAKAKTYAGVLSQQIGKALKISEFKQANALQQTAYAKIYVFG
jgi:uncharacterized protein YggE